MSFATAQYGRLRPCYVYSIRTKLGTRNSRMRLSIQSGRISILLWCAISLLALMLAGAMSLAWHGPIAPTSPPARTAFPKAQVERGARLAAVGNCMSCHTGESAPFSGGRALGTPFGTIYSTNVTPDPATGIGNWPETAFRRALREGVARDGSQLYPAFPYDHFTRITDEDMDEGRFVAGNSQWQVQGWQLSLPRFSLSELYKGYPS